MPVVLAHSSDGNPIDPIWKSKSETHGIGSNSDDLGFKLGYFPNMSFRRFRYPHRAKGSSCRRGKFNGTWVSLGSVPLGQRNVISRSLQRDSHFSRTGLFRK